MKATPVDRTHPELVGRIGALQIPPARPREPVGGLQLAAHGALLEVIEGVGGGPGVLHGRVGEGLPARGR